MSLIRTQGLLTIDKVPQWGREKIFRKKKTPGRAQMAMTRKRKEIQQQKMSFFIRQQMLHGKKLLISAKNWLGLVLAMFPTSESKVQKMKKSMFLQKNKEKKVIKWGLLTQKSCSFGCTGDMPC